MEVSLNRALTEPYLSEERGEVHAKEVAVVRNTGMLGRIEKHCPSWQPLHSRQTKKNLLVGWQRE